MSGLIDTVKFKSPVVMDELDKRQLRAQGFRYLQNVRVLDEGSGEVVAVREMFHDEKTGVRVLSDERDTRIEGSIPRVLGLDNALQESLTESDGYQAFEAMTSLLLPFTSEKIEGQWGLTRLDLARNFKADVPLVVGAYSLLKHPEIRSTTKTMFGQSVMFYGKSREVIIYDKGLELGGAPGKLGRAECRWMGMKGIDKLIVSLSGSPIDFDHPRSFTLPLWVSFPEGRKLVYVHTDYNKLNDIMKNDLIKLGTPLPVNSFNSISEVALHAMIHHPEEYSSFLWSLDRQGRYRWNKKLKQYKKRLKNVDVVQLIWGEEKIAA